MSFEVLPDIVALVFGAANIVLLLSILSRLTAVAEAPRAWNLLTLGLGLIMVHFSVEVFMMVNPYFAFTGVEVISDSASLFGFGFLFAGVYYIWQVMYE